MNEAAAHRNVLQAYIDGKVDKSTGMYAYNQLKKHLPKEYHESYDHFGAQSGLVPGSEPALPPTPQPAGVQFAKSGQSPAALTPPPGAITPNFTPPPQAAPGAVSDNPDDTNAAYTLPPPPANTSNQSTLPAYISAMGAPSPQSTGMQSPPSQGFGGAIRNMLHLGNKLPFPPGGSAVTLNAYTPEELGQREVAKNEPLMRLQAKMTAEGRDVEFQQALAHAKLTPGFEDMTPRQKASLISGKNISPEFRPQNLPGLVVGSKLPEGTLDGFGNPIDTNSQYKLRIGTDGVKEYFPEVAPTDKTVITDVNSPTGFSSIRQDKTGKEISRIAVSGPSAFATVNRSSSRDTVQDIDGQKVKMTLGSSSTSSRTPYVNDKPTSGTTTGTGPTGNKLPAPPGANAPRPTSSGGRVLGMNSSTYNKSIENPYTAGAQKILEDNEPVLKSTSRAMAMLEKIKDSNIPFTDAVEKLGYNVGMASEVSDLINNLELGKVIGSARLLKGASRSMQALQIAMKHLPDVQKDSPRLMYEKLQNIQKNLNDISDAAKQYGQKYPGLNKSGSGGLTPPPSDTPAVTHKVGDSVMYEGKKHKITEIKPNGRLVLDTN